MVCLHISLHEDSGEFTIQVDRLLREDATPRECAAIDKVHDTLRAAFDASPDRAGPILDIQPTEGAKP